MARLRREQAQADGGTGLCDLLSGVELPTFPAVVMNAIEQLADPDVALDHVGDVLARDPGVSVQLLSVVNSAAFSPRNQVRSVHQAVVMLGRNEVESMLLSVAVHRSLPRDHAVGYEPDRFWAAAARRASVAVTFAEVVDPARRSEHFTAALLQDMASRSWCAQGCRVKPRGFGPAGRAGYNGACFVRDLRWRLLRCF